MLPRGGEMRTIRGLIFEREFRVGIHGRNTRSIGRVERFGGGGRAAAFGVARAGVEFAAGSRNAAECRAGDARESVDVFGRRRGARVLHATGTQTGGGGWRGERCGAASMASKAGGKQRRQREAAKVRSQEGGWRGRRCFTGERDRYDRGDHHRVDRRVDVPGVYCGGVCDPDGVDGADAVGGAQKGDMPQVRV